MRRESVPNAPRSRIFHLPFWDEQMLTQPIGRGVGIDAWYHARISARLGVCPGWDLVSCHSPDEDALILIPADEDHEAGLIVMLVVATLVEPKVPALKGRR